MRFCILLSSLRWWCLFVAAILIVSSAATAANPTQGSAPPASSSSSSQLLSSSSDDIAPPECNRTAVSPHRYHPLACWLLFLKVQIPDQKFHSGIISLEIKDLQCTHFAIGGVDSHYQPSSAYATNNNNSNNTTSDDAALQLAVHNVSATCMGSYHSTLASGEMIATVGGAEKAVQLELAVTSNTTTTTTDTHDMPLPEAVTTRHCGTALAVEKLDFSGSVSAHLIQLFQKEIRHYVSKALAEQLCPTMPKLVDPQLTAAIQELNRRLAPYYSQQAATNQSSSRNDEIITPTPIRPGASSLLVEAPFLVQSLTSLNQFLDNYLNAGLLEHWFPKDVKQHSLRVQDDNTPFAAPFQPADKDDDNDDDETTGCSSFFGGVNGVVRSVLHDSGGQVHFPLPRRWHDLRVTLPAYGQVRLDLLHLTLSGVDQWQRLQLLAPRSTSRDFVTLLQTSTDDDEGVVAVQVHVNLTVSAIPGGMFQGQDLQESFDLALNLTALDIAMGLSLQVDNKHWPQVQVGTVAALLWALVDNDVETIHALLPCLTHAIASLTTTEVSAHMVLRALTVAPLLNSNDATKVATPTSDEGLVTKGLEEDIDAVANNVLNLFLTEYHVMVSQTLFGVAQGPGKNGLNDFFQSILVKNGTCQAEHPPESKGMLGDTDHEWVNFTNVEPLVHLQEMLRRPYTLERINRYLDCTSHYLAASLRRLASSLLVGEQEGAGKSLLPKKSTQQIDAPGLQLVLRELRIDGAGSVKHMEVLSPQPDGLHLKNGLEFATATADAFQSSAQNRPKLLVGLDMKYPQLDVSAEINMTIAVGQVTMFGGTYLKYDLHQIKHLALQQVLHHGQCVLAPAAEFDLPGFDTSLGLFDIVLNASVATTQDGQIEHIHIGVDSESYPSVQDLGSAILAWALNTTHDVTRTLLLSTLSQANNLCEGRPAEDQDDSNEDESYTPFLAKVLALFLLAQPVIFVMAWDQPKPRQYEATLTSHDNAVVGPFLSDDEGTEEKRDSLLHSRHIPDVVRVLVPVLIFGTITLLLSSNLSTGATVDLEANFGGRHLQLSGLFEFSLVNTARDMLEARIYPLLLLVVVFSGIWPYAKLCLLLAAFIVPKNVLTGERRGRLLFALDALSKFSLVDTYVLILMVVAFRFHLELSKDSVLDVFVSPMFGFYGFLTATILSLVAGHLLVFYHRRAEINLQGVTTPAVSLCQHSFSVEGSRRRLSRSFVILLFSLLFAAVILLAVGMTRKSFVFEFGGLAGMALGDQRISEYSLLSLGSSIRESVENGSSAGVIALQAAYFFYTVIAPFVCLLSLFLLLCFPLSLKWQLALLTLAEITNAWSAIEVFCLSIVASLLEISTFASFIVGNRCDLIDEILNEYFNDDGSGSSCYSVDSYVEPNVCFLVVGVLLNSFFVSLVSRIAHTALDERVQRAQCTPMDPRARQSLVERLAGHVFTNWIVCTDDTIESQALELQESLLPTET